MSSSNKSFCCCFRVEDVLGVLYFSNFISIIMNLAATFFYTIQRADGINWDMFKFFTYFFVYFILNVITFYKLIKAGS